MNGTRPFSFLTVLILASVLAVPVSFAKPPDVQTYDELLHAIRGVQAASQKRVEQAVEQEKVREAWEIGKLIDGHVLQHKERADYGTHVIERLAGDLGMDRTELYRMLEFSRAYPIVVPGQQLSWSHYKALLSIEDPKEREAIAQEAVRESWDRDRLRKEIRRRQASKNGTAEEIPAEILAATPGKPGTYRVVKAHYGKQPNQLVLDLGFSNYYRPPGKFPFQEGDIVTENKGRLKKTEKAGEKDLFTFQATVIQVIDGDTITAAVQLGFGFTTVQTLRLRALDAPEIDSADGREAKAWLASVMPSGAKPSSVLIKTVRSDKYDRYLADVWVGETYLNQKLIDKGLAVRVSE